MFDTGNTIKDKLLYFDYCSFFGERELTESLLADHRVTGLAGLTLTSFVDSFDPKGVLLFFLQALQLVFSQRNVVCDADPFLTSTFLEFNNVAFDLCPTIMLWSGPC